MERIVAVLWKEGSKPKGRVEVVDGRLGKLTITGEGAEVSAPEFAGTRSGSHRLEITVEEANLAPGAAGTRILIRGSESPFSFFLRDVSSEYPIYLPDHGAIVTDGEDSRSFEAIERGIQQRGFLSRLQRIESEDEETYANAAANTRMLKCPTWLGLSRDVRIFEVDFIHNVHNSAIRPRFHGTLVHREGKPLTYAFVLGRGAGCVEQVSRGIEEGMLPILHARRVDDDVTYDCVAFVTLETRKLSLGNLRGTHFLVADGYAAGHRFTEEQEKERQRLLPEETGVGEDTVLYFRAVATNTADVPRYAWFMTATPNHEADYDGEWGFGLMSDGNVFSVNLLDGKPLPQEEMAVLLPPGKSTSLEFRIPHGPISKERAARLSEQDFETRRGECRTFWKGKLKSAAGVSLPEKRIDEMVHAGLLHLDIVAYGREPDGPVAPTIGVYSPIGSESSPIIQFMDSMGWHDLARRCLMYFLEKQHDDGFMQNFDGYMLETGAALWNIGEHYRYTRDENWVKEIAPKVLKSCEYIINWRRRNQDEVLRGKGYGLLDGKVADPEDQTRQFVLNGYAYLGLARTAEMLALRDAGESARLTNEASALRNDIRTALFDAMARSPVVPLGDGSWCPSSPAWAEAEAATYLLADGERWFTHGTFTGRESLIGPHYLAFQEVIEADEAAANWLVNAHTELLHTRNVAFSQPYYSRHPWLHLRRGEVKAFLKAYYNGFAGLADRETYTFWEHYFHASPHKTHEEGWFLMQTRWMLYMETGETLNLLCGVPRAWLERANNIVLKNVASYFGPISLRVEPRPRKQHIRVRIKCSLERKPKRVAVRVPHPKGRRAKRVSCGAYDAQAERVIIDPFPGEVDMLLEF